MKRRIGESNSKKLPSRGRARGVVLEDIDEKLDIVIEAQQGLAARQEKLEHEVSGLQGGFSGLENEFSEFRDETRENFKTIFQYLSRLDDELADIKKELAEIRSTLVFKADIPRVEALEERVRQLEVELASYKKNIS